MRRISLALVAIGLVAAACSSESTDTTEASTDQPPATTTTQAALATTAPTTTSPPTTTAPPPTTTAGPVAEMVPATPVFGLLEPYNDAGGFLFPTEAVEAHWYQWDGLYVVLYRGWDASNGTEICAGNSWRPDGGIFQNITNSAHLGEADQICVGTAGVAQAPSGVYACNSLLYYITEIPTDSTGNLWGTLEIGDGEWAGQTSETPIDLAATPEFEPGLAAYELLPTDVDAGGVVECS